LSADGLSPRASTWFDHAEKRMAWLLFVAVGLAMALFGALWLVAPWLLSWLGGLPGDIRIESENGRFYFPVTTCLLLSALLSLVTWIVRLLRG
jgi:hypothetical protein